MADRNSWARAAHDLGLATWFGGSLMGAVGLNAAAKQASSANDRIEVANAGWARWTPVNAVGIAAYTVGGAVLTWANKGRLAGQSGVGRATMAKNAFSLVALAATGYSRVLGQRLMDHEKVPVEDGTTPVEDTPPDVKKIQQQLKVLQYQRGHGRAAAHCPGGPGGGTPPAAHRRLRRSGSRRQARHVTPHSRHPAPKTLPGPPHHR